MPKLSGAAPAKAEQQDECLPQEDPLPSVEPPSPVIQIASEFSQRMGDISQRMMRSMSLIGMEPDPSVEKPEHAALEVISEQVEPQGDGGKESGEEVDGGKPPDRPPVQ